MKEKALTALACEGDKLRYPRGKLFRLLVLNLYVKGKVVPVLN